MGKQSLSNSSYIVSDLGGRLYEDEFEADILIVAEKNSVAEAFAKALAGRSYTRLRIGRVSVFKFTYQGKRFLSIGLKGHVFNFDFKAEFNSWKNTDPRALFFTEPVRVIEKTSKPYYKALRKVARNVELVYLALDADAEGESIAFEVIDIIKSVNPYVKFKRLWFNSTVKGELLNAIKNPVQPNRLLAEKCFARMIIDLTIGAAFTRLITLAIERRNPKALPFGRFLSYGPCQSPTLFLVVQRAWEREKFKPEKFYTIAAKVEIHGAIYEAEHVKGRIRNEKQAREIYLKIKDAKEATVRNFKITAKKKNPPIPLTTVEMESRASKFLNIRPKNALDIAEELYRRGYISYPRTETEIYNPTLNIISRVKMLIENLQYGSYVKKLLSKRKLQPTRGTKDDKAHPPIHPTKSASPEEIISKLGRKAWRLYDLIVRHFLATFSKPAIIETRRLDLDIKGEKFIIRKQLIREENYLEVYPYEKPQEEYLPELEKGEKIRVVEILLKEGETKPPPYLSESELLKLMDKYGIGTDATKQDHIFTNIKRGYMYVEKKRCIPTPLGKKLIETLYRTVEDLVKPEVRGFMEKMFLEIAHGKAGMNEVIEKAKKYFIEKYDLLKKFEAKIAEEISPVIRESINLTQPKLKRRKTWRRRRKRKT